jgi:TRAP transporter 4TM/12TM fusion protein
MEQKFDTLFKNIFKKKQDSMSDELAEKLAQYDSESRFRNLGGFLALFISLVAISFSIFQLNTGFRGVLLPQIQRPIHLAFAMFLIYLLYPASQKKNTSTVPWYDYLLAIFSVVVWMYLVREYRLIMTWRAGAPNALDLFFGAAAIFLVLEATRRVIGFAITGVAIVALIYSYFGPYMPGIFAHRGFSIERIINHMYMTTEGIIGIPIGVSATFVFLFILFGAFLNKTGLGQFFIDFAIALSGHTVGGPAKVAVMSSAMMGSISGSSVANVVTTGSFTIPLMKSIGYRKDFAGAVEAAASTGGQVLPPVMGAAAFIMAEFLGISYIRIAISSVIPALLYFLSVGIMVHYEAARTGLKGLPIEQIPKAGKLIRERGFLVVPIFALVYMLVNGYTPLRAAFVSIIVSIVAAMFKRETRLSIGDILDALDNGARSALGVVAACATAGIVVGTVTLTGLGLKMANAIVGLAGGSVILTLIFTMIASIILGAGLPTTAKYIILAVMAAPALIRIGIHPLAAHLFILYFGIIADLTPPVALAAYAGAGVSGGNAMKTGFIAMRLALAGFIIPYIFAYNPSILLIETTFIEAIVIIMTSLVGVYALAVGVIGFWNARLMIIERIFLLLCAFGMIWPGVRTDIFALIVLTVIYFLQKRRSTISKDKI